jgi:hypothetical protein
MAAVLRQLGVRRIRSGAEAFGQGESRLGADVGNRDEASAGAILESLGVTLGDTARADQGEANRLGHATPLSVRRATASCSAAARYWTCSGV